MRATREEFIVEMKHDAKGLVESLFNTYNEFIGNRYYSLKLKFIEARGYFEGFMDGVIKAISKYSKKECDKEMNETMSELKSYLLDFNEEASKGDLLYCCYELIDGLAILIYGKEEGGTSEWI